MNTTPWFRSLCAAALALTATAAPIAMAADNSPTRRSGEVVAADNKAGQSADDIVGQNVRSMSNEDLGKIHDLVVDTTNGQIVYALVSSGGFLGIGDTVRAVPFGALRRDQTEDSRGWMLDLKGADWASAPTVRRDQIVTLTADQRGEEVFRYYQQDWPRGTARKGGVDGAQLARVSEINGMDVRHKGREIGDIDDVIVNLEQKRASVLLDPEDDVVGTDRDLAISFSQLSRSGSDDDVFETTLTPEQLQKAAPMPRNRDIAEADYPFAWSFGDQPGAAYTAATTTDARRTPVGDVRRALRNDPELRDLADGIELRRRGDKLVVTGRVPSEDAREKVADKVSDLANGWNIDNRLSVGATAE